MYSTLVAYLMTPLLPKFLDFVLPLNESRPTMLPLPTKYGGLDPNDYYIPMTLHADIVVLMAITIIVAMDATYAAYVEHACGLFVILGHKLEHSMEVEFDGVPTELDSQRQEEATYRAVASCVKMHRDTIEFANMIESTHYVVYFFVLGLIVFSMSISGYQVVVNLDKPGDAFRYFTLTIGQVVHIFFLSWPGQRLIDHSERVHEWAYGAQWYHASARSRRLLVLIMLRSKEPCRLTAGKFYIMSLENFNTIVRTSASYFTVLTSFT